MLSPEEYYVVRKEQYADLRRQAARERLIQEARLGRAGNWGLLWRVAKNLAKFLLPRNWHLTTKKVVTVQE